MGGIDIIFRIAAVGILAAVVSTVLKQSGKDELGTIVSLAAVVITLLMVINLIAELFGTVRNLFSLY
ncbi:MAG: stage III sporulation protein AC [Firmicutes bacterium]|nr:stage III sporulation protein AC [Bacillota bacterium]